MTHEINSIKRIIFNSAVCCCAFYFIACNKKDETLQKPHIAIAAADSVKVYHGYKRIKLSWKVTDPTVKRAVVYGGTDSVIISVNGLSSMSAVIGGLDDGNYSFIIYLYDGKEHKSSGAKIVTHVYGDDYVHSLINRPIESAVFRNHHLYIIWSDPLSSAVGTEVCYTDSSGIVRRIIAGHDSMSTILRKYKRNTYFKYRTLYLPVPDAIDTFYSAYETYKSIRYVHYNTLLAQRIIDNTDLIDTVYTDTAFKVSAGVQETDIYFADPQGDPMHVFILKADLTDPEVMLEPTLAYGGDAFHLQTVPEMAGYSDSAGHRVVAAINADLFHADGSPWGIVVENGTVLKDSWQSGAESTESYLAILSDGTSHIGSVADFSAMKARIKDALGGSWLLEKNNILQPIGDASTAPRTGVGISDSGLVYFIVADGRDKNYSNGLTLTQLGEMLKACGTRDAINLDGGGSSTFVTRSSDGNGWQIRNRPSDGNPRAVGDAWLVIADIP